MFFWAFAGEGLGWFSFKVGITLLGLVFYSVLAILFSLSAHKLLTGNYAPLKKYKNVPEDQLPKIAKQQGLLDVVMSVFCVGMFYAILHLRATQLGSLMMLLTGMMRYGQLTIESKYSLQIDESL